MADKIGNYDLWVLRCGVWRRDFSQFPQEMLGENHYYIGFGEVKTYRDAMGINEIIQCYASRKIYGMQSVLYEHNLPSNIADFWYIKGWFEGHHNILPRADVVSSSDIEMFRLGKQDRSYGNS